MKTLIMVIAAAAVLAGCAPSTTPTAEAQADTTQRTADGKVVPVQDEKSGDVEVVNDPAQVTEGGAYRIEPKNPNDKIYQPDPRLAGGG